MLFLLFINKLFLINILPLMSLFKKSFKLNTLKQGELFNSGQMDTVLPLNSL